jgi:hypothetical protein
LLAQAFQIGKNITNDHKLYQTAIKCTKWPKNFPNGHENKALKKFTQICDFWFENKPSGNPGQVLSTHLRRMHLVRGGQSRSNLHASWSMHSPLMQAKPTGQSAVVLKAESV